MIPDIRSDDRAVSPVIGVILMVAITVILAAVIGTFVLGLGDQLGDNQPTAQLAMDLDQDADSTLTIEHNGGDSIASESLTVLITGPDDQRGEATDEFETRFSVGDEETAELDGTDNTIGEEEDVRIRVIHQPSDSILLDRTLEVTVDDFEFGDELDFEN
ncbi:type IV pilin [Halorubrum tibetense]|uniref:Type IV pilin n=1 Tax=Halorubrum tibetense TaxID=175631 RepID=A0ABD5SBW3_9EURY